MLQHETQPVHRAMRDLIDLAHTSTEHSGENAWLFALTWLAMGRLAAVGGLNGAVQLNDLLFPEAWSPQKDDQIPSSAKDLIWGPSSELPLESSVRASALRIVSSLVEQHGTDGWDVVDAAWQQPVQWRGDYSLGFALAPELCDLTLGVLDVPKDSTVWIPFDPTGQLVIRALKRDLNVIAAGPGRRSDTHLRLLTLIEDLTPSQRMRLSLDAPRSANGSRELICEYLLAIPPFGMKIVAGAGWRQWEGQEPDEKGDNPLYRRLGHTVQVELDRTDSWAVAALWPRVQQRAVFVLPPTLLFARGKEQRLREHLLASLGAVDAVAALPGRLIGNSAISSALLLLQRDRRNQLVRLIDSSEMTTGSKSSMRYSRQLQTERVAKLITGQETEPEYACTVSIENIAIQDFNLVPSRYLRRALNVTDGTRCALGELVTVIRAPVASKDPAAITVQEAGFQDLDNWRPITGPFSKLTAIHPRKLEESVLRSGDILITIKGTLGKTGLIGHVPTSEISPQIALLRQLQSPEASETASAPVVSSQSCIALRIRKERVSPKFLLLFLRSDDFKMQIESLRVGATIAHVTPSVLLQEIHVPNIPLQEQGAYMERYEELCEIEALVEEAEQRSEEIRKQLWPVDYE